MGGKGSRKVKEKVPRLLECLCFDGSILEANGEVHVFEGSQLLVNVFSQYYKVAEVLLEGGPHSVMGGTNEPDSEDVVSPMFEVGEWRFIRGKKLLVLIPSIV